MTVAQARNIGLSRVETEYVVFLDADDALHADYLKFEPKDDITATSITYRDRTSPIIPRVWTHERRPFKYHDGDCTAECLPDGNWVHVGAIIRTEAIRSVGGFKEWPVYEDWALFLELQQAGYSFGRHPESVYRASVRQTPGHRNQSLPLAEKNKIHEQIYERLTGKKYEY